MIAQQTPGQECGQAVGILTALPEELEIFLSQLQKSQTFSIAGFKIYGGFLENKHVFLAQSAAGKVNASSLATVLALQFQVKALVFSGVAGGLNPDRKVGDLIVGETLIQHDYGALIDQRIEPYHPGDHCIGPKRYQVPFEIDPTLKQGISPLLGDEAAFGTILTGDQFVNCAVSRKDLFQRFKADAVDMEGAAVAQVATRFGIPWLIVRCLSDLAGDDSDLDFTSFLTQTAQRASKLTLKCLAVF